MSSSNVQEYGIGLDIKSAIRDLKKFQRIAQQFNKKMRADKQQALAEAKKSAAAETKVIKKALTKQEKDLMKKQAVEAKLRERELKAEAKFNLWKRAQTRKLVDSQLKAHQKLEIKRLLATKGTEQQIRDQYDETLRKFRLNKRKEVAAEKAANKKRIADHKKTAKIRSKLGNAVTMAIQAGAAVLTGGGAMVATGGRQYAEDRANAANSGMDVKEYQEKTYKYSQATNLTKENLTDVFQDTNDRLGSKQFLERNKEGQATGADAGLTDTINAIEAKLGKQLSNSQIDKLFSGSADEVLQKMKATFDGLGMSTKEQTFLFESMASNSWRLVTQLEKNSAAIKQAEDDYKRLGLGIQNTAVVDEVTSKFKRMWGIIEQSPMEAFESFSKAISPETMAMLQVASEKIFQFVSREVAPNFRT